MLPSLESQYTVKNHSDYVCLKITGVYNSQQFLGYPKIMLNACRKVDSKKLIVDATEVDFSNLSTMERFFLGEEIANVISYRLAVAMVVPKEIITNFLETVATNRGANLFVVSDFNRAEAWIRTQD